MTQLSQFTVQLIMLTGAAIMAYILIFVGTSLYVKVSGKQASKHKTAKILVGYAFVAQLFWILLSASKMPVPPLLFAVFYSVLFIIIFWVMRSKWQKDMKTALLYSLGLLLAFFVTEMLVTFCMGVLFVLVNRGLTDVITGLL